MTPVEATRTSFASQPSDFATSSAVFRAVWRPGSPVAAFALPELRIGAGSAVRRVLARDGHGSGAEAVRREGSRGNAGLLGSAEGPVEAVRVAAEAGVDAGGADTGGSADAAFAGREAKGLGRVGRDGDRKGQIIGHGFIPYVSASRDDRGMQGLLC